MGKLWIVHFPPPFNASPHTKDCACFDNWESSHSCQQSMTWERRPSCQKEQTRTNCLDYRLDWCQATDAASSSFSPSFWCLLWQMQSFPAQFLTSSDAESSFYQTYAHASKGLEHETLSVKAIHLIVRDWQWSRSWLTQPFLSFESKWIWVVAFEVAKAIRERRDEIITSFPVVPVSVFSSTRNQISGHVCNRFHRTIRRFPSNRFQNQCHHEDDNECD